MKILVSLISLILLLQATASLAEEGKNDFDIKKTSVLLYKIEAVVEGKRFLLAHLDDYLKILPDFSDQAGKCITRATELLAEADKNLEKLGEEAQDEPTDVAFIRRSLVTNRIDLTNKLASCKALRVRSDSALKEISQFRQKNLERKSFDRGPGILNVIQSIRSVPEISETRLVKLLKSSRGANVLNSNDLIMLLSILIFCLLVSIYVRSALTRWDKSSLIRWQQQHLNEADTGTRFIAALLLTTRRYVLPALISVSLAVFIAIKTSALQPTPLITIVTYDLPLLVLALALIYFTLIALPALGLREDIEQKVLSSLRFRLALLAITIYLGNLLFQGILTNSLAEVTLFLARAILCLLLVLNIIWVLWLTKNIKGFTLSTRVRILTSTILIAALIAEISGYRNLSSFTIKGVIGSFTVFIFFQVFTSILDGLLKEFNSGKTRWQRRFRQSIGVKGDEALPGYFWVRLTIFGVFWSLLIVALLTVWGVPVSDMRLLTTGFMQGFSIGSFKVVPIKVLEGILALIVLLSLNSWFQKQLSKRFLANVGIERGASESISTISNYIGIAIVIIISLAVVGMDFSKLAIIAGALSVGVGFGLQNVVNNFVSGLILLFERPIKTGDWILAGGVEGTVKKISIRSTQIQDFDGADIIIPNSELISGTLTNWELKRRHGRVRVPISVAYGSNTEEVKKLLLTAAAEHPDAIKNTPGVKGPQVVFLAFGDSSLDFELRFFIKDIKKRITVLSDLNFTIDAVFRQHSIEIPFPQRQVHIQKEITETKSLKDDRQD